MPKTVEIIIDLMNKNGLNAHQLEVGAKLSNASIQAWSNGRAKPSVEALIKIADYFGVSVDYLLGRDAPNAIIERPIAELADKYKNLFTDEDFMKIAKVYEAAQDIRVKGLLVGYFIATAKANGVDTAIVGY